MGQKSSGETLAAILLAFLKERTWSQAKLAAHVGVGVAALRRRLDELVTLGHPLTRDEDHPNVFWSLPPDWFPGGVAFAGDDAVELLRLLGRLPHSPARERFIRRIIKAAPRPEPAPMDATSLPGAPSLSAREEAHLRVVEDAAVRKVVLHFRYQNAGGAPPAWRHASVQHVHEPLPARFLGSCHRRDSLRWFRIDAMFDARLDETVAFRVEDPARVEAVLAESLDGFHQGGPAVHCSFTVLEPEARWVGRNLSPTMAFESIDGGIRVTTTTGGLDRLARFVVGLGGAARCETPQLAARVRELAQGALGGPPGPAAE